MGTCIDLRVHAGASTTRKDDDRYRAQAAAYGNFRSTRRLTLLDDSARSPDDEIALRSGSERCVLPARANDSDAVDHAENPYEGVAVNDTTIFLDDTQLGYSVLESQLYSRGNQVLGAKPVTPVAVHVQRKRPAESVHEANELPCKKAKLTPSSRRAGAVDDRGSSPSQSSYLKTPVLDRSRPQGTTSSPISSPAQQPQSLSLPVGPTHRLHEEAERYEQHQELRASQDGPQRDDQELNDQSTSHELSSQLPTTYSLSDITSDRTSKQQSVQRSVSDPGPALQSSLLISQSIPNGPHTQHANTHAAGQQLHSSPVQSPASVEPLAEIAGDVPLEVPEAPLHHTASPAVQPTLPITIQPPPPETGLGPLKSHVTPTLAFLASQPSLISSYKPVFQARELRPTERGCWTFSTDSWPADDQIAFFDFMSKMIGEGRVGWGVHCVREAEDGKGTVKVFCWGEVVMHVYLLLYAASKSKVGKMGLQWVDAEGQVVVQMRGAGDTAAPREHS